MPSTSGSSRWVGTTRSPTSKTGRSRGSKGSATPPEWSDRGERAGGPGRGRTGPLAPRCRWVDWGIAPSVGNGGTNYHGGAFPGHPDRVGSSGGDIGGAGGGAPGLGGRGKARQEGKLWSTWWAG